jgi:hypothetical protein
MSDPSQPEAAPDPAPTASTPRRPQFGEYATPEEQRAHIRQPSAVTPPAPPRPRPTPAPAGGAPLGMSPTRPAAVPGAAPRARLGDRIATVALLGYGLFSVLSSIPAFVDYTTYAQTLLKAIGVDVTLSDPGAGHAWGIAAGIVLGVGWLLTAFLSALRLRAGRMAWWIPVVGGIVFNLIASGLMVAPLLSDPAVWAAITAGQSAS